MIRKRVICVTAIVIISGLVISGCINGKQHPGEPEMVFVEGGTFTMGCTAEQDGDCWDDEKPAHQVTVKGFYIGRCEVTQAQWKAIMGTTVRQQRDKADEDWDLYGEGDNYPVYYVSWDEAQEFISRLNKATGKKYRLPTEAEWEYAARGGKKSRNYKYSGSNSIDEVAWYWDNSDHITHPVGTKSPNELGIYDMSGNVWEWCSDWFGYYSSNSRTNPTGPTTGSGRIFRGGCWGGDGSDCCVSRRYYLMPDFLFNNLGFRLACSSK
jgi:formylglycine-generating enzyme required for sulfatase activity